MRVLDETGSICWQVGNHPERLVLALTNEGDSLLDPYMGVGSSIIAALKHNRNGYGCDLERRSVDLAWERVTTQGRDPQDAADGSSRLRT